MEKETVMPFPVRFSPFKHHRNYILGVLSGISPEAVNGLLDPICNNYVDVYTGVLTPEAIGYEVISILKANGAFRPDDYARWLEAKKGYRKIRLQDRSEWIVRKSNETERYVHLHPAYTGPFTVRFKGSTLKTVYLLKAGYPGPDEKITLENVNGIRKQIGLSPVKKLEKNKGLMNCCEKFFDRD